MALVYTTVNRTIAFKSYERAPALPCFPFLQSFNATTHQTVVAKLTRESRPKPPDLLTALTPRQKQYVTVSSPGFQERYLTTRVWCSSAGQYLPVRTYDRLAIPGRATYPIVYLPPWQNDLRQNIADLRVNLAENLAEYRETGNMFVDVAKTVDSAWADFRNRNWKRLMKRVTPENVAAIELTARYGIKPLVSDLEKSIIALNGSLNRSIRRRISSRSRDHKTLITNGGSGGQLRAETIRTARAQAYIEIDPKMSEFHGGSALEGAWAVIPYSFVFDWFIDVGSWLQSLDALRGIRLIGLTVVDEEVNTTIDTRVNGGGYKCTQPSSYFRKAYERYVPSAGIPMAELRWNPSGTWSRVKAMTEILTNRRAAYKRKPTKPWA